jgi:uncharacterized protein DUF2752
MSAVLTVLLGAGALMNPQRPLPVDLCLLKSLTGIPCPTCGLTRAICNALHGDWAASLAFHPAGILVLFSLVGWIAWSALEAWRGQVIGFRAQRTAARLAGAAIAICSLGSWLRLVA